MNNFKQLIITRFNIKLFMKDNDQYLDVDKRKLSTQTDEWLKERFIMFEQYCFPSVKNQTNQDFLWICLFDVDTPNLYKEKIADYTKIFPNFKPHYIEPTYSDDLYLQLDTAIRSHLLPKHEYVISTNLDNDDSIHKDLTKRVEEVFKENPTDMLYRFVYGYQYFEKKNYLLKMKYPHNHFLTLVRKVTDEPIKAVTHYYHARAHKIMEYTNKVEAPLWMEIVHASNINNDFRVNGRIRYTPTFKGRNLQTDFNINVQTKGFSNTINAFTYLPWLFFSTIGKKLSRKILKNKNKGAKL